MWNSENCGGLVKQQAYVQLASVFKIQRANLKIKKVLSRKAALKDFIFWDVEQNCHG